MEVKSAMRGTKIPSGKREKRRFVPIQAGIFDLLCADKGHAEGRMTGRITIR